MARKLAVAGGIAALAILAALAVLLIVEFDSPGLGKAVLERVGTATGATITAKGFRLSLLRGLVLQGVEARSGFTGGRAAVTLDRLVLKHRFLPLLTGRVAIARIVLRQPRVRLVETRSTGGPAAARRRPAATAPTITGGLTLLVSEIDVEDGSIELQPRGRESAVRITGIDLRLKDLAFDPGAASPMAALSAGGEIRVREIALAPTRARGAQGRLRLDRGRFEASAVRFRTDEGSFEAEVVAHLDRLPFAYTLALEGDLDLGALTGYGKRGGFGPGHLELKAEGLGGEAVGVEGQGHLALDRGTLPPAPLLVALEKALGRRFVGSAYKPTQTPFRVERGRVLFEGFRLEAEQLGLEAGGWAGLDGSMELSATVSTPRQGLAVPGVPDGALDAMTDEEGWVRVPFKVTGTRENPRVWPDAAFLSRVGAKALARKGLEELLGKKRR